MQEVFSRAAAAMPPEVVSNMAAAAFRFVGDALIALLCHEAVPAFNLYAIFRLHDDVAALAQLADSLPAPHLAVRLHWTHHACSIWLLQCCCLRADTHLEPWTGQVTHVWLSQACTHVHELITSILRLVSRASPVLCHAERPVPDACSLLCNV